MNNLFKVEVLLLLLLLILEKKESVKSFLILF